jgi:hypothetical protein
MNGLREAAVLERTRSDLALCEQLYERLEGRQELVQLSSHVHTSLTVVPRSM